MECLYCKEELPKQSRFCSNCGKAITPQDIESNRKHIFLHIGGEQQGPFSIIEVNDKIHGGEISIDDYAWHDGCADWIKVSDLSLENIKKPAITPASNSKVKKISFDYKALDSKGNNVSGSIDAIDQADAVNLIRNIGLFPTSVVGERVNLEKANTNKSRYAIVSGDQRPFCTKCNKHVQPLIGSISKNGPGVIVNNEGPVDFFVSSNSQFTRKFCSECGDSLSEIRFCSQCKEMVPVKVGEMFVGVARGGYQETQDCRICNTRLSGPSCFIATAAFGSSYTSEVECLRSYRDEVLLKSLSGRIFVACYYYTSPPIAELVTKSPSLAAFVRSILRPLVNHIENSKCRVDPPGSNRVI